MQEGKEGKDMRKENLGSGEDVVRVDRDQLLGRGVFKKKEGTNKGAVNLMRVIG